MIKTRQTMKNVEMMQTIENGTNDNMNNYENDNH